MKQAKHIHFMTIALTVFILSPILSTQETAVPDMTYILAMTIPPILYFATYAKHTRLKPYHIAALLLPLLALISSIMSDNAVIDLRFFKYLLLVFYFVVITNYRFSGNDLLFVGKIYVALSIALGVLILLSYQFGYVHNDSAYYMGRYSIGITGLYKNPNYITSFMNLALFVLLFRLFFCTIRGKQKYLTVSILILFLVSFYLSGTRASLVTVLFYSLFLFLFYLRTNTKNGNVISIVMAIFFCMAIVFFVIRNMDQVEYWVDMFVGGRDMFSDESRIVSWGLVIDKWSESFFWGQGLFSWYHFSTTDTLNNLHNVFIEFLLYQGVIGFAVLLFVILNGYSKIKKQDRIFVYGFLFVTAFPLFFQNGLIDVNFFKFLVMNRIVAQYSLSSKEGIVSILK